MLIPNMIYKSCILLQLFCGSSGLREFLAHICKFLFMCANASLFELYIISLLYIILQWNFRF